MPTVDEALSSASGDAIFSTDSDVIIPATTPTLTVTLDKTVIAATSTYNWEFSQGGNIVMEKKTADLTIGEDYLQITLTQLETGALAAAGSVEMQIHGTMDDGTSWKTNIMSRTIGSALSTTELKPGG